VIYQYISPWPAWGDPVALDYFDPRGPACHSSILPVTSVLILRSSGYIAPHYQPPALMPTKSSSHQARKRPMNLKSSAAYCTPGLASSSWRFRPAGGRALANFEQLPSRGSSGGGHVQFGGTFGRNAPRFGSKISISPSKTLPQSPKFRACGP
jgi:hypothetical protein